MLREAKSALRPESAPPPDGISSASGGGGGGGGGGAAGPPLVVLTKNIYSHTLVLIIKYKPFSNMLQISRLRM